jgi:hypothetical protein
VGAGHEADTQEARGSVIAKVALGGAAGVFEGGGAASEDAASTARFDLLYRQISQLKVENDFWHESSANESGGTARSGRARSSGVAGITPMRLLAISRSWVYRRPAGVSEEDGAIMR